MFDNFLLMIELDRQLFIIQSLWKKYMYPKNNQEQNIEINGLFFFQIHFRVLALSTVPLRFISRSLRLKEARQQTKMLSVCGLK